MSDEIASMVVLNPAALGDLYDALTEFVYEATHLSPQEDDGSHMARITGAVLTNARAALAKARGEAA